MAILFDGINHPTAQQVINAGCVGALMYGGTQGDSLGKDFTAAQYADYKAHGLVTAFVFENLANDMASGFNGGAAHARALLADLTSKGVRNTEPVGATVDEHVVVANIPLAVAYQNGFWSAVKGSGWAGPVGGYGFSEFLVAIHNAGIADWYWGAGARSSMPPYTNVWQDNTGVINVGGSADDRDWILIPLEGTMDWSDPLPNPIYDPANKNPADERSHPTYTALQFIEGPWVKTLTLPTQLAQLAAQLTSLQGALTADEATLVGVLQGVDSDTKAGVLQVVAAFAAVPAGGSVDVKTLAVALAPLLPAEATPQAIADAVRAELEAALAAPTNPPAGGTP